MTLRSHCSCSVIQSAQPWKSPRTLCYSTVILLQYRYGQENKFWQQILMIWCDWSYCKDCKYSQELSSVLMRRGGTFSFELFLECRLCMYVSPDCGRMFYQSCWFTSIEKIRIILCYCFVHWAEQVVQPSRVVLEYFIKLLSLISFYLLVKDVQALLESISVSLSIMSCYPPFFQIVGTSRRQRLAGHQSNDIILYVVGNIFARISS